MTSQRADVGIGPYKVPYRFVTAQRAEQSPAPTKIVRILGVLRNLRRSNPLRPFGPAPLGHKGSLERAREGAHDKGEAFDGQKKEAADAASFCKLKRAMNYLEIS